MAPKYRRYEGSQATSCRAHTEGTSPWWSISPVKARELGAVRSYLSTKPNRPDSCCVRCQRASVPTRTEAEGFRRRDRWFLIPASLIPHQILHRDVERNVFLLHWLPLA